LRLGTQPAAARAAVSDVVVVRVRVEAVEAVAEEETREASEERGAILAVAETAVARSCRSCTS
jgi:hypothetical protein